LDWKLRKLYQFLYNSQLLKVFLSKVSDYQAETISNKQLMDNRTHTIEMTRSEFPLHLMPLGHPKSKVNCFETASP
jgi:hypothetical protein